MSNNKKLIKKVIIKGEIIAETGLLIGGSNSALEIGGIDKYVIRNPINDMPYIPGSSLKGKMRSLLELSKGTISVSGKNNDNYGPTHNSEHLAAQLFGYIKHKQNDNKKQRASRVIVRDGELINPKEFDGKTDLLYTEIKAENTIDRITSKANPRFFERVPKDAKFRLEIIINIFKNDNEKEFYKGIFAALNLLEDDYLGGGGSRGNGQVRLNITEMIERTAEYYTENKAENDILEKTLAELKV